MLNECQEVPVCVILIAIIKSWHLYLFKLSVFQEKYPGPPQWENVRFTGVPSEELCPYLESSSGMTTGQLHEAISSPVMSINFPCHLYTYIHTNQLNPWVFYHVEIVHHLWHATHLTMPSSLIIKRMQIEVTTRMHYISLKF